MRVKVCGITNKEDALVAVKLGADALGFIFAPSPRRVTPERARDIIRTIPPFVDVVGVFVNEDVEKVRQIMEFCGLGSLQFHGEEPPSYCHQFDRKVIKSFSIKDTIPENIFTYKVDAYLLDTFSEDRRGGTGKTFNWSIARQIREKNLSLIISGGLTPENVTAAIEIIRPYAVDVASGVEESPGKKSKLKLVEFFKKVRKNENAYIS